MQHLSTNAFEVADRNCLFSTAIAAERHTCAHYSYCHSSSLSFLAFQRQTIYPSAILISIRFHFLECVHSVSVSLLISSVYYAHSFLAFPIFLDISILRQKCFVFDIFYSKPKVLVSIYQLPRDWATTNVVQSSNLGADGMVSASGFIEVRPFPEFNLSIFLFHIT